MKPTPSTRRSRWRIAIAVVGILAIGGLDYLSGFEVRVYPLYLLPLSLGAWHAGRRGAFALAALASAAWAIANTLAGLAFSHPLVWISNICTELIGFATVGFLFAELRRRLDFEASLSRVDTLTGLGNARAFRDRLALVLALARRAPRPTTIAYIDLDNFKLVNDSGGHAAGDELLRAVGRLLKEQCRQPDVVGRLGGDEFLVMLPMTSPREAMVLVGRVQACLLSLAPLGQGHPVTVSIGVAAAPRHGTTVGSLMAAADAAMYKAKRAGGRRAEVAGEF